VAIQRSYIAHRQTILAPAHSRFLPARAQGITPGDFSWECRLESHGSPRQMCAGVTEDEAVGPVSLRRRWPTGRAATRVHQPKSGARYLKRLSRSADAKLRLFEGVSERQRKKARARMLWRGLLQIAHPTAA